MRSRLILVGCVLILTVSAWKLGSAQTRAADFYVTVDAPVGELKVTCAKGCDWRGDQGDPTTNAIVYRCASQPCRLIFNGKGRITMGQPN